IGATMSAGAADVNAILPVLTVVATALIVLVADWFRPDPAAARPWVRAMPAALSMIGLAVAAAQLAIRWGDPPGLAFATAAGNGAVRGLLRLDAFGIYVGAVLVITTALVVLMG